MSPEAHCDKWLTPWATNPGCLVLCLTPAEWLLFSHFRPDHSSSPRQVFSLWSIITSNGLYNWMRIIHWRLLMGSSHQDLKRAVRGRVDGGGRVWDGSRGPHLLASLSASAAICWSKSEARGLISFTAARIINKNLCAKWQWWMKAGKNSWLERAACCVHCV